MARTMEVTPARPGDRRSLEPRSTRVVVRKVGAWSVLKFSLLFYFCLMLVVLFGLTLLYQVLGAIGTIDSIQDFFTQLFLQEGDPTFKINGRFLFTWAFYIGCFMVLVGSLINVFITFLYNLISDVVGGVELTLTEKR